MALFNFLFGKGEANEPQPNIRFGRYSDSYKKESQYDAWDLALEKFENEDYLDAYEAFFVYLRDEEEDNVLYWKESGGIRFEVYQGSKKITGFADNQKVRVEAKVAHSEKMKIDFMKRLIEQNYSLEYTRFAIDDDDNISVVFDTYTLDGSPYKLYYALREMAVTADKQDDLLIDEFRNTLLPIDNSHLTELPDNEKLVKYNLIIRSIQAGFDEINNGKLDASQYPGGIAYLLLNLSYKLDYLTKPEGYMMEALERIHRLYFANDGKSTAEKNQVLLDEFQKLLDRPKEEYFKEMYSVKSTFGITSPVNHDRVVGFIDGELHNMDWYQENNHDAIACSIPGYIVGYCMFYFAIPKPDRDFFHLYYRITESDYFKQLGFTANLYDSKKKSFNRKAIKQSIKQIIERNEDKYLHLNPNTSLLNFGSMVEFSRSFLLMVRGLDLTRVD